MKFNINIIGSFLVLLLIVVLIVKNGSRTYTTLDGAAKVDMDNDCVFVVSATWCGHCKALKQSGELEKTNKDVPVVIIPHDHPESGKMMHNVDSKGFPTIIVCKNKKIYKYDGARKATGIVKFYNSL